MAISAPTADFVTSTLNGAITSGATTATIGASLNLPATNGVLQINYDSTLAVGVDQGPETIQYSTYTSGTGALTGLTRGQAGTTGVAHANGASVQAGASSLYFIATPVGVTSGGTGVTTLTTAYGIVTAGTTPTGAVQTLAAGTSGQLLSSGGASATPTWLADPISAGTNKGAVYATGTRTAVSTGALTDGQILIGSTAGNPAAATITAGSGISVTNAGNSITIANTGASGQITLLKAGTGTDTSAGATNVDTFAITGLTAKDTLYITYDFFSLSQQTANVAIYENTSATNIAYVNQSASITAGKSCSGSMTIRQSQHTNTVYNAMPLDGLVTEGAGALVVTTPDIYSYGSHTAWTGSWTIALRHGGVTGGGTLYWGWSLFKIAGQ